MQQTEQTAKPFFAQFLENDKLQETAGGITKPIWDLDQTQKAPSDRDEV